MLESLNERFSRQDIDSTPFRPHFPCLVARSDLTENEGSKGSRVLGLPGRCAGRIWGMNSPPLSKRQPNSHSDHA